jgi:hypothetical protein
VELDGRAVDQEAHAADLDAAEANHAGDALKDGAVGHDLADEAVKVRVLGIPENRAAHGDLEFEAAIRLEGGFRAGERDGAAVGRLEGNAESRGVGGAGGLRQDHERRVALVGGEIGAGVKAEEMVRRQGEERDLAGEAAEGVAGGPNATMAEVWVVEAE